jgi:hypothetical protein
MDFTQGINLFVESVSDKAVALLLAIAGIGALSMAVIQTIKELTPARRIFNRRFVRGWIAERSKGGTEPERAENQLIELATAGDDAAFYELPIEQLCGQANAAAQLVLEYPRRYEPLLRVLAARADPNDVATVLREPPEPWKFEKLATTTEQPERRTQGEIDARTRIISLVQRSLDALQISASHQWKFRLQILAFLLSYTLTVVGIVAYAPANGGGFGGRDLLQIILVGLASGFLAPIARDLVATIQRRKT